MPFRFIRDARTRFILRRGIVPWGILAGIVAAAGSVAGARDAAAPDQPMGNATLAGIAILCFVVWCFVAGWAIGAVRWEMRASGKPEGSRQIRRHQ